MLDSHHEQRDEDLGARLRAVRELAGATQRDVAKAAGLSSRELQAAERGAKRLSDDELRALAGALGVDPEVLVGAEFHDELGHVGSAEDRIDQFAGHDPTGWHDLPASADDSPARPEHLPNPERRKDFATRDRIEQSWREVRTEMGDVLAGCARLTSASSGDDLRRLLAQLELDLQQLKANRTFLHDLAQHERVLQQARGTGGNVPVQPQVPTSTDIP